jgi:hypothetical protein
VPKVIPRVNFPYVSTKVLLLHDKIQHGACFGNWQGFLALGAIEVHTFPVQFYPQPRKISFLLTLNAAF